MPAPLNDGSMDLPYQSQAETPLSDRFALAGGVVTMAATVEVEGVHQPALVLRFARADGRGFLPPVLVCVDDQQMHDLGVQVTAACRDAIRTARHHRRDTTRTDP